MDECITKAQAIEIAESLRPVAGDTVTNAYIKGIEGLPFLMVVPGNGSVCVPIDGVWYRHPNKPKED